MSPIRPEERIPLLLLIAALAFAVWAALAGQMQPVQRAAHTPTPAPVVAVPDGQTLVPTVTRAPTRTATVTRTPLPTFTITATPTVTPLPSLTTTATTLPEPPLPALPSAPVAPAPTSIPPPIPAPTPGAASPQPPAPTPTNASFRAAPIPPEPATDSRDNVVVLGVNQYYTFWWILRPGQRVSHTVWVDGNAGAILVSLVGPNGEQLVSPRSVAGPVIVSHLTTTVGQYTLWLDRRTLTGPELLTVRVRTVFGEK